MSLSLIGVILHFITRYFTQLPPPSSPLFPYTTLFRSCFLAKLVVIGPQSLVSEALGRRKSRSNSPTNYERSSRTVIGRRIRARDRKSTRLNSSHTVISYAVFCFKKK